MSWEEDYLMQEVRDLKKRVEALEAACLGNSSEASTKEQQTTDEKSEVDPQKPAQTTASHSAQDPKASSSASSTGGSGTAPKSTGSSDKKSSGS